MNDDFLEQFIKVAQVVPCEDPRGIRCIRINPSRRGPVDIRHDA